MSLLLSTSAGSSFLTNPGSFANFLLNLDSTKY